MADDELDTLYFAPPDTFTAQRTKLAAAAKERGDAAAAKRISSARKPTTAAWIVNRLVIGQRESLTRLAELGDSLRAAHVAMDGVHIRELSARQHHLINELTQAAFDAAEMKNPSSTVRDDIAGTLQAAIADPEVRERLGRLAKAERWSGFGDFGDSAPVSGTTPKRPPPAPKPSPKADQRDKEAEASRRQREKLTEAVAAAERAQAQADSVLTDRRAERDEARTRRDEAAAALGKAERALAAAQGRYDKARQASRVAAAEVKEAKAQLKRT